ncbi:hypothetical protein LEMLEM_LOCUS24824 [Lemmus lemmus]
MGRTSWSQYNVLKTGIWHPHSADSCELESQILLAPEYRFAPVLVTPPSRKRAPGSPTPRRADPRPPPSLLSAELPPPSGAPPSRSGPRRPARRQHPRRRSSCPQRACRVPGSHTVRAAAAAAETPHGAHGVAGESRAESGWGLRRAARRCGRAEWTSCAPGKLRGGLVRLWGSGTWGSGRGEEWHGDTRVPLGVHCTECASPTLIWSLMLFACGNVDACFGAYGSV